MLSRIDHYLLTHYPKIWQSRIVWVFLIWLAYASLCMLAGLARTASRIEPEAYVFFFFVSVTGLILYFIFFTRYNYFKWYGNDNYLDPLLHFGLILASVFMIYSGVFFYELTSPYYDLGEYFKPRKASWNFIYYSSLVTASLIYIFRHVPPRQFILGIVFSAIFWIFYWLFALISGAFDRSPIYFLFFLALVFMVLSLVLSNRPSHALTVSMMILYQCILPFSFILLWLEADDLFGARSSSKAAFNQVSAMVITLVLVQFVSAPIFRRQWGNEG